MSKDNKYVVVEYSPSYPDGAICADSYSIKMDTIEQAEEEVEYYKKAAYHAGFLDEVRYEIYLAGEVPNGVV